MPNDQFLAELQAKIAASDEVSWVAEKTSLHGLSDELLLKKLGAVPPPGEPTMLEREKAAAETYANSKRSPAVISSYPPSVDWRNDNGNYVTPVLDQGQCGSCVAFGTAAAIESQMRINKRFRVDTPLGQGAMLSEAQLYFCNNRCCAPGQPCYGWWPSMALNYARDTGIIPASDFPYSDNDQPCALPNFWQEHITQLSGYNIADDAPSMKTWLAQNGPLITAFSVYEDFYSYSGGVYKHVSGDYVGGHCVCVIGYDEQMQAWLCKNSWGTGWGEQGFFWIGYGQCGIDSAMYEITGFAKTYFDWMGDSQITTTRPSTPATGTWPALAMNDSNGLLYLAYGSSSDESMWWSWYDGKLWRGDVQIQTNQPSTPTTSAAPALAMYKGILYLVYRSSSDESIWYSWFDGTAWNGDIQIQTNQSSTPGTSAAPALVVYNDLLYLVYQSTADQSMWYSWFDGTTWYGDIQIQTNQPSTPTTSAAPALAVNGGNNTLYLVYKASGGDDMWWSWFNGADWQGDVQIQFAPLNAPQTSNTPAMAVNSSNMLYLVYDSSNDDTMWYSEFPGYVR